MIFDLHGHDRPLADEVREAEHQLQRRHHQLYNDLGTLDTAVRRRVTAPDALLWSVATGFIIGELTKRTNKRTAGSNTQDHSHADTSREEQEPGTLQLLLGYIAIARPIISSVSAFLSPFLHRSEVSEEDLAAAQATEADDAASSQQTAHQPA